MAQPLIILGTGGNAYDVLDIVEACNAVALTWEIKGFLDDSKPQGSQHGGLPVLGRLSDAVKFKGHQFINAIGSDRSHRNRSTIVAATGLGLNDFATLIHPRASVSRRATIGRGVYISHGASVAGAVVVGNHVTICPNAVIGHDATIGDWSIIAPGAIISGSVRVGQSCYIGAGASIRQQINIGERALLGIGTVVIRDVEADTVVVGNPARLLPAKKSTDAPQTATSIIDQNVKARVDVIIPCYKYAHFLRDCVQSVLMQDGVDVRVLIIDDASPDDTPVVAQKLAKEDSRVEYRRHAVNQRHIKTYNEGLEWVSATYMLLLSADDMLTPGALLRATRVMDAHPEVGMTYGHAIETQTIPSFQSIQAPPSLSAWKVVSGLDFITENVERGENMLQTPTAVVRTAVQKRIGGYREELTHSGDWEMWLRIAAHSAIGVLEADQAYYRLHGQNMSVAYYQGTSDYQERAEAFDALFSHYGSRIGGAEHLWRKSRRVLAEGAFWHGSHQFDRGDIAGCRASLELAIRLDPSVRWSAAWMRFRCKRAIGPGMWQMMRPLINRLRGRAEQQVQQISG